MKRAAFTAGGIRKRLTRQFTLALAALWFGAVAGHGAPFTEKQRVELFSRVSARYVHADTDGDRLFDDLAVSLAVTPAEAPREVIVRFKPGREGAAAPFADRITRVLTLDNSVVAPLTGTEIRQLAASGAVESIEENVLCFSQRDTSQVSFGVSKARQDFSYTGNADGDPSSYSTNDMVVAVIDSGVDGSHPSFGGGKILRFRDFVNNRTQAYDDSGHGTHVASIAVGAVVNGVGGVAPGAALVAVKVADSRGASPVDRIAAGIDWCIENRQALNIKVISISMGGSLTSAGTDAHSRAADRAVAAGLVVIHAAGNSGPLPYTIGGGGAAARTITVGNFYDTGKGGFALADFSSRGPTADGRQKPDICAPGVSILAAQANTGGLMRASGTSMSAPFVAGVVALMLQANPNLTPDQVKMLLKSTAVPWGPPYHYGATGSLAMGGNTWCGAGRLDAYAAIARAANQAGAPPAGPDHLSGGGFLAGLGAFQVWEIPVDSTQYPIAITMNLDDANTDFDIYLIAPNGRIVDLSSFLDARQETILYNPAGSGTGIYRLEVESYYGAGFYWLDVSAGTSLK